MQEEKIRQLVTQLLGQSPRSLKPLSNPFGQTNEVWQATLPDQNVIVRTNREPGPLSGTAAHLAALTGLGLPVPQILKSGLASARFPAAYQILTAIPGRELRLELPAMSPAQIRTLAGQVIDCQRRVATLPTGTGYGRSVGNGTPGVQHWAHFLRREVESNLEALADYGPVDWAGRIRQRLADHEPALSQIAPACFLDDLSIKNVLVADGQLTGFIDVDWLCHGDPLYWLGLIKVAVAAHRIEGGPLYLAELYAQWPVTADQERLIDLYATIHALSFLVYRHRAGDTRTIERLHELIDEWC